MKSLVVGQFERDPDRVIRMQCGARPTRDQVHVTDEMKHADEDQRVILRNDSGPKLIVLLNASQYIHVCMI